MIRRAAFVLTTLSVLLTASRALAQTSLPTLAFGAKHAVALRDNGDVLTWGDNVMCQLGRGTGGRTGATPTLVMRNAKEVAAASEHTLVLTSDGKVYGWGMNAEGVLGTGDSYDKCEGPVLVASLEGKPVAHIATGYGFSVAVTATGDLYCTGDNSMGQCPAAKGFRAEQFTLVPFPELAGKVAEVRTGLFHTLVLTTDRRLFAFGRSNDGQLGAARGTKGLVAITGMTDVVSFAAGTWHSVAARADGSVWTWGANNKSQLCEAATASRQDPARVALPAGVVVEDVAAGGHSTVLRASDGRVYGCGDNQTGLLGVGPDLVVPTPTPIPGAPARRIALGGAHAAISPDGCTVRLAGATDDGVVPGTSTQARTFASYDRLSLCGPSGGSTRLANIVHEAPRGGESGCWAPRKEEDGSTSPKFAGLRLGMLAAETLFRKNEAFMAAPEPVRMRTSLSAGPSDSSARMHIKAVAERKRDGTRVWATGCGVIPQLDRIGGAIAQVSVFFNTPGPFISTAGLRPKLTGQVAGYPEYNGWVLITKGGRLPWIPETLDDALAAEGARRDKALEEWTRTRANMKAPDETRMAQTYEMLKTSDPAAAEKFLVSMRAQAVELQKRQGEFEALTASLEKDIADHRRYRASFTSEQLAAPAVWGDPKGGQALTNLRPGDAERAIRVKPDPAFPDSADTNRIELIAVLFSPEPDPAQTSREAWREKTRQTFDFAALAALLR